MEGNVFMENMFNLMNRGEDQDLPLLNFEEFVYLTWNFASCDNLGESLRSKCSVEYDWIEDSIFDYCRVYLTT